MSKIYFERQECNENKCEIDETMGVCPYCLRTQEEIDYWEEYSDIDKKFILKTIARRREILKTTNEKQDLRWVF